MAKINIPLKLAFLALLFLCFGWTNHQKDRSAKKIIFPYDTLQYDRVVAYDYEGDEEQPLIVLNGNLQEKWVKNQKELSQEQIVKIHKTLGNTTTYGAGYAFCFDPHIALVYYYKKRIVGWICISLECNYLRSSIKIPASETKRIYYQNSKKYYPAIGFSKIGWKEVNDFCKELNFSHCKDSLVSMFDK